MDSNVQAALSSLIIQRDKLLEMLQVTKDTVLTPTTDSVDIFVDMVKKREELLADINSIHEKLESPEMEHVWQSDDDAFNTEAERVKTEIREIVRRIAQCDEVNRDVCAAILDELRKAVKDVKKQKNMSNHYQYDSLSTVGNYFDKSK